MNGKLHKTLMQDHGKEFIMWDTGIVVATIAFFIVAWAYTSGCDRLSGQEDK